MLMRYRIPILIFVVSQAVYITTLAPTVQWGDYGGFQTRATIGELELHPFGHPLWNVLAFAWAKLPIGDHAFRINLSSAVYASIALVIIYFGVQHLTQSVPISLLTILALGISHLYWTYAVMPKAYALTLVLLSAGILLCLQWNERQTAWRVVVTGVLLGLGVMNHLIVLTALPAFVIFLWLSSRQRLHDLSRLAIGFAAGLLPYVVLLSTAPAQGVVTGGFVTGSIAEFVGLLTSPLELLLALSLVIVNFGYEFFCCRLSGCGGCACCLPSSARSRSCSCC